MTRPPTWKIDRVHERHAREAVDRVVDRAMARRGRTSWTVIRLRSASELHGVDLREFGGLSLAILTVSSVFVDLPGVPRRQCSPGPCAQQPTYLLTAILGGGLQVRRKVRLA